MELTKLIEIESEIDFLYYQIGEINESLQKPLSPLERMIDDATQNTNDRQLIKELVTQIINLKKEIGEDYSYDEQLLNQL